MAKDLIICFSRADENYAVGYITKGNTEIVAQYVRDLTGADLFMVEPEVPYAKDYKTCVKQAKERVGNAPVKAVPEDLSSYDTIYVLSPIYFGTYAPEVATVLKQLDFTGKKVRVIVTHEGSGLARVVSHLKKDCRGADIDKKGLAIRGQKAKDSKADIENWL